MPSSSKSLIYELPSVVERINFAELFPTPQPIEVELGCGDSTFLVSWAQQHPGRNLVGVERLLGRLNKLNRKGLRAGLTNLRGVRVESRYFVEYLLPARSVQALHIYFPDPWPKRKHERHRLINERFPIIANQALAPGGSVFLRTDDANYFAQMKAFFGRTHVFRPAVTPEPLAEIPTDFEKEFVKRGVPIFHAAYQSCG